MHFAIQEEEIFLEFKVFFVMLKNWNEIDSDFRCSDKF